MSNIEYEFLLHKTKNDSPEVLEDIFNNGLLLHNNGDSIHGMKLHDTLYPIDKSSIKQRGLGNVMKEYLSYNEESDDTYYSVFLIKIPKDYMGYVMHRNGTIDPAVPFFKKKTSGRYLFTPHLVRGVYNGRIDSFITNPNFSPVFDPSGLEYSFEQYSNFKNFGLLKLVNFVEKRMQLPYDELYNVDKKNNMWDKIMNKYVNKYQVSPKNCIFDSTEYASLIEEKKNKK